MSSKREHENDGEVDEPERKVCVNKFEVNQELGEDWDGLLRRQDRFHVG